MLLGLSSLQAEPIKLRVMSYNTHLFGELVIFNAANVVAPLLYKDEERKQALKAKIASDPADIILLQEVWSGAYAHNIEHDPATENLYPNFYAPSPHHGTVNDLGLVALTRAGINIKSVSKGTFRSCYSSGVDIQDAFIEKGFIRMICGITPEFHPSIQPGEEIIVGIIFTHMITNQSQYDDTALCCYKKMEASILDFQKNYPGAPVIFAGDFNNSYRDTEKYERNFENLILKSTGLVNAFDVKRQLDIVYRDYGNDEDPGLLGAWDMNEVSGNLLDSTERNQPATPSGTPAYGEPGVPQGVYGAITVTNPIGRAISFGPGSTEDNFAVRIAISGTVPRLDVKDSFTAMGWISPAVNSPVGFHRILGNGGLGQEDGGEWALALAVTNATGKGSRIQFSTYGRAGNDVARFSIPFDLTPGRFAHVAVTLDSDRIRFYLNGSILGSSVAVPDVSRELFNGPDGSVVVGGRMSTVNGGNSSMRLDGVRVYEGALDEARIREAALIGISGNTNTELATRRLKSDLIGYTDNVTKRIDDPAFTFNKMENQLSIHFQGQKREFDSPDHIFFRSGSMTKLELPRNGIKVVRGWAVDGLDLSDHYPLLATFELTDPRIHPLFPKFKWSSQPDVVGGEGVEGHGELSTTQDRGMVVVGVGCRVYDNNVDTLHLHVAPILADGTLGPAMVRRYGVGSIGGPEVDGMVGNQEVVVGIGLRASGGNFKTMRLLARRLDPATGKLGTLKEYRFGPEKDAGVEIMVQTPDASTLVTGVGVRVKQNNVRGITLNTGTLNLTVESPQRFQAWRRTRFSAAEVLNEAISGPNADPDLDGASNVQEFVYGTNPKVKDASRIWTASRDVDPITGLAQLRVNIPRNPNQNGVNVVFEECSDLSKGVWTPIIDRVGNADITMGDTFSIALGLPRVNLNMLQKPSDWPLLRTDPTSTNVYIRARMDLLNPQ